MESECILWRGRIDRQGYGRSGPRMAHRAVYEREVGPIPDGLDLDHTCGNRACINVAHLEPVDHLENVRRAVERRTTCRNGHPRTPENTYYGGGHGPECQVCRQNRRAA